MEARDERARSKELLWIRKCGCKNRLKKGFLSYCTKYCGALYRRNIFPWRNTAFLSFSSSCLYPLWVTSLWNVTRAVFGVLKGLEGVVKGQRSWRRGSPSFAERYAECCRSVYKGLVKKERWTVLWVPIGPDSHFSPRDRNKPYQHPSGFISR